MRRYSAVEAIEPAWRHTRALLWQDRNRLRLLKLCLVAMGAELGTFSFGFSYSNGVSGKGALPPEMVPVMYVFLAVFAVVGLAVWFASFYLGSRLQLAFFDIVLLRDGRVSPAWRRHGGHTWRWMGAKALVGGVLCLLLAVLLVPAGLHLMHAMQAHPPVVATGGVPHIDAAAIRAILAAGVALFVSAFAVIAALRFFSALALPGLAMQDLRFGQIFMRAAEVFWTEPGAMLTFAVVQPLLLLVLA